MSLPWSAIVIVFIILQLFLPTVLSSTTYSNPSITVWGSNLEGRLGYPLLLNAPSPLDVTSQFSQILSNNYTWNVAYGLSNVNTIAQVITYGITFTAVVLTFRNGTDNAFIGQTILMAGDNSNTGFGFSPVPYNIPYFVTMSHYQQDKFSSNPMRNKEVKKMKCWFTCILSTTDNSVFVHRLNGLSLEEYIVPTSFYEPIAGVTVTNANIADVFVGGSFNEPTYFALLDSGHVFSWGGWGDGFRIHTPGNTATITTPTLISYMRDVRYMAVYSFSGAFINSTYHVMVWGSNSDGALGIGNTGSTIFAVPQFFPLDYSSEKAIKVTLGENAGTVLTMSKNVYVFGKNYQGEASSSDSYGGSIVFTPYNLTSLIYNITATRGISGQILDIERGIYAGFCLFGSIGSSKLLSWGRSPYRGRSNANDIYDVDFGGDTIISEGLAVLHTFTLVQGNSGKIYAFGDNAKGQMAYRDYKHLAPSPLTENGYNPFTNNLKKVSISAVSGCSFMNFNFEGASSTLHNWGLCDNSISLNSQAMLSQTLPQKVNSSLYNNSEIVDVKISTTNGIVLTDVGKIYGWGRGAGYQLGSSYQGATISTPIDLFVDNPDWRASKISVGTDYFAIQLINGSIAVRGNVGNFGATNLPTYVPNWTIFDISNATTAIGETLQSFATCQQTFYLLTTSGKVFAMGDNANNRISSGSASQKVTSFTRLQSGIIASKKIIKIACGALAMFLSDDGYAMYYLGGTSTSLTIPNSELVVDISVGDYAYYAELYTTNKGNIYARGRNEFLQAIPSINSVNINSPQLALSKSNGKIPLTIASGDTFNIIVNVDEWQCFGKNATSLDVCSGNGFCTAIDTCRCFSKFSGSRCHIGLFYPPSPLEDYFINTLDTIPATYRYKMSNRIAKYIK